MHCFFVAVVLFSKKTVKFVGREDILSPLVILRQHALAYNRIIALGTDSAETLCSRVVLLLIWGVGRIKRKLSREQQVWDLINLNSTLNLKTIITGTENRRKAT